MQVVLTVITYSSLQKKLLSCKLLFFIGLSVDLRVVFAIAECGPLQKKVIFVQTVFQKKQIYENCRFLVESLLPIIRDQYNDKTGTPLRTTDTIQETWRRIKKAADRKS